MAPPTRSAPTVLEELGAEVFTMGVEPNGRNINDGCGSLYPERVAERVRVSSGQTLGSRSMATRTVWSWSMRKAISPMATSCWRSMRADMVERGVLSGGKVVATVMSNLGLEKALKAIGVDLIRTQVGDRYVVEAMRKDGFNLGGEQSGHNIFLDHNTSGDGLISALQVLAIMRRNERMLSELASDFVRFPADAL